MILKFLALFLILFMSAAVNLPQGILARLGFDADYLLAALFAIVIAGLVTHRRMFLVILVVLCAVGTNLPKPILDQLGVNQDVLFATLVALVVVPFIAGRVGFD